MDRPIKVSVACQKGGAGKSTITTLLANKLYFEHGKKVIFVDCNYPQLSLLGLRTMESQRFKKSLENAKQNDDTKIDKDLRLFLRVLEEFPNFMKDFTITTYPKEPNCPDYMALKNVKEKLPQFDNLNADIVLFDTIGSASDPYLLELLVNNDYVFVPIEPETLAATSSVAFIKSLNAVKTLNKDATLKGLYAFFNKVEIKVKSHMQMIKDVAGVAKKFDLDILKDKKNNVMFVENKKIFQNDMVRSTIIPTAYHNKLFAETACNKALDEMINIILSKQK